MLQQASEAPMFVPPALFLPLQDPASGMTRVNPAQQPEAVVQRHVEAYNAQDMNTLMATLGLDVVFGVFPGKVMVKGKADCATALRQSFTTAPSQRMEVTERMVAGSKVIDHLWIKGRPDGRVTRGVQIYEVQGGVITAIWFLAD